MFEDRARFTVTSELVGCGTPVESIETRRSPHSIRMRLKAIWTDSGRNRNQKQNYPGDHWFSRTTWAKGILRATPHSATPPFGQFAVMNSNAPRKTQHRTFASDEVKGLRQISDSGVPIISRKDRHLSSCMYCAMPKRFTLDLWLVRTRVPKNGAHIALHYVKINQKPLIAHLALPCPPIGRASCAGQLQSTLTRCRSLWI